MDAVRSIRFSYKIQLGYCCRKINLGKSSGKPCMWPLEVVEQYNIQIDNQSKCNALLYRQVLFNADYFKQFSCFTDRNTENKIICVVLFKSIHIEVGSWYFNLRTCSTEQNKRVIHPTLLACLTYLYILFELNLRVVYAMNVSMTLYQQHQLNCFMLGFLAHLPL